MKMQERLVIVTVMAITAMFITQARAEYRAVGADGIAASPKVRQMLNERGAAAQAAHAASTTALERFTTGRGNAMLPLELQSAAEQSNQQAKACTGCKR